MVLRGVNKSIVFQPAAYQSIQRGINKIVDAIKPTLGPVPRLVAIERILDKRMPELLDSGATIAERITALKNPDENIGAMLVRDFLLHLQDQAGDGTALGAVLLQAVYNESIKYVVSGGSVVALRANLEKGMRAIIKHLSEMTVTLKDQDQLAQTAETLCQDAHMAQLLGEIFEIIGEYGRLEVRPGRGLETDREYVEGMYWDRGVVSRKMLDPKKDYRIEMQKTAIVISDFTIEDPRQLHPVVELARKLNIRSLLIVAKEFSDSTIASILLNSDPEKGQIAAVKLPGYDQNEESWALQDLAVLTGGRPFLKAGGDTFERMKREDFGFARRTWADRFTFGIVGGKGDPRKLRTHITQLRNACEEAEETVLYEKLRARVGKLMGGTAVLWVGGQSELEIENRQALAKRTASVMREAMRSGVLPGGGVSLLASRSCLDKVLKNCKNPDERAAYGILRRALEKPFRLIIENAGFDTRKIMAEIEAADEPYGFDIASGRVVNMIDMGIWDAAEVVEMALYGAVKTAAMALTIDVMVHNPDERGPVTLRTPSPRKKMNINRAKGQ
jgi:chaperonin GroEL